MSYKSSVATPYHAGRSARVNFCLNLLSYKDEAAKSD